MSAWLRKFMWAGLLGPCLAASATAKPPGIDNAALANEYARGSRICGAQSARARSGNVEDVLRSWLSPRGRLRDLVRPAMHGSHVQPTVEDMARYEREIDNVRAALDWS